MTIAIDRPTSRIKEARIDFRLMPEHKAEIAEAAKINGLGLTDYLLSVILPAARYDIESTKKIQLSNKAFNAFLDFLEAPDSPRAARLRNARTIWD